MRREIRIIAASTAAAIFMVLLAAAFVAIIGLGGVVGLCVVISAAVAAYVTSKHILKRLIK